ncbi:hypothetical protein HYY69_04855 [Candidatus Woesearchaeota archaeon]|nr:hypothetical protein [Candidatus Woesearchaeota archaeon]
MVDRYDISIAIMLGFVIVTAMVASVGNNDNGVTGYATKSFSEWKDALKEQRDKVAQQRVPKQKSDIEEAYEKMRKAKTAGKDKSFLASDNALIEKKQSKKSKYGMLDNKLVGSWRPFSEAIFYDNGGNNWITPVSRRIELSSDGTWNFGTSTGTWSVAPITNSDWSVWKISSYGPTRKIILDGWNKGISSGPIEESGANIDFFWVIYHSDMSMGPATIQMKFGH